MTEVINGVTKTYNYTYNEDNQLISETVDGITVEYTYDGFGRLNKRVVKNGTTEIYSIEPSYSAGTGDNGTSTQVASYNGFTYTYDNNGNILSVSDGTNTTTYVYDSQNQLIRENNQAQGYTHTWTYNSAGNIQARNEYAYTLSEELDIDDAIDSVSYNYQDTYGWGDLLTSYDGKAITYDTIGNPETYDGWTYTWQHGRQLASMSKGNTTWTYTYNADGLRTKRTNGTETYTYIYNGSQLVRLIVDAQNSFDFHFTYDASGTPLTVTENGNTYYYVTNLQGDVIGIKNSSGQQFVTYTYDVWGNETYCTNTQLAVYNPLRYRGYVYDHETGLYYLQSRYYNPQWGRFINADALAATGQGFAGNNMFTCTINNPVNMYDPSGTCSKFLGFLWKIDCHKATCKSSKNYNPNAYRVAVLYDGQTSGVLFGKFFGVGFKKQANSLIDDLEKTSEVESYSFSTINGYIQGWNSLSGSYDAIFIVGHGYPGGFSCSGESIGARETVGTGKVTHGFDELNPVLATSVYLFTCNGATSGPEGFSAAYYIAELTQAQVWGIDGGAINYDPFDHTPYNVGGHWSNTFPMR